MSERVSDERLAELRAVTEAATPGTWHWAGNTDYGEPYLATWLPGMGRCQVLSIGSESRSTTGRAADKVRADASEFDLGDPEELVADWAYDRFGEPVEDPRLQFMTDYLCVNARELAVYEVAPDATTRDDPEVYRADITGIRHPDAVFMAAFDPPTVLALLDELAEHRASEAAGVTDEMVEAGARAMLDCWEIDGDPPSLHEQARAVLEAVYGKEQAGEF